MGKSDKINFRYVIYILVNFEPPLPQRTKQKQVLYRVKYA